MSLGCYNHDIVEVLCGAANQGDASYVYFLDNVGFGGSGGYCIFKGIEVHDHQVDVGDIILGHLQTVSVVFAPAEDAAEHFGV